MLVLVVVVVDVVIVLVRVLVLVGVVGVEVLLLLVRLSSGGFRFFDCWHGPHKLSCCEHAVWNYG